MGSLSCLGASPLLGPVHMGAVSPLPVLHLFCDLSSQRETVPLRFASLLKVASTVLSLAWKN